MEWIQQHLLAAGAVGLTVLLVMIFIGPRIAARDLSHEELEGLDPKARWDVVHERRKLRNEVRAAGLHTIVGIGTIVGLVIAFNSSQTTSRMQTDQAELTLQQSGREHFTKITDRLGHKQRVVRTAALTELSVLPDRDPDRTYAVARVLNSFVRDRAPWPPRGTTPSADTDLDDLEYLMYRQPDVFFAVQALGEGALGDSTYVQLSGDLRKADLRQRNYSHGDIRRAHLEGAMVEEANLFEVMIVDSSLRAAGLRRADLRDAEVYDTDLQGADLSESLLCGTDLSGSDLSGAALSGAKADSATIWPDGFDPGEHAELTVLDDDEACELNPETET